MNKSMSKQGGLIALTLAALLLIISWGSSVYANDVTLNEAKTDHTVDHTVEVDPQLLAELEANGRADYLIYFRQKADLSPAYKMDWQERGHFVMNRLRETAETSQKNVRAYLDSEGVAYRPFWIDNIIAVESVGLSTLNGLLNFSEIERIQMAVDMFLIEPEAPSMTNELLASILAPEPNLVQVKATDAWALGFRGEGTVIANIDSGVRYTHQALVNQYRGNLGGGTFNHNFNWLDPDGGTTSPTDTNGHGTHVMGTMIGYDGGANEIGVAPESEWIACRGCLTASCPATALLACAEWIAAPYAIGDPGSADPDLRPLAVNNSWGNCQQVYNDWYQGVVDGWHAAGIFPIFANGNSSNCGYSSPPGLNTVGNPARYGNVTGVGSSGTSNGMYAPHSNWGPTDNPDTVNPQPGWADLKPQVIAPGVTIRSSVISSDSAYASAGWTGTSMSAPHVAGMIALMWQAAPCLIGDYATTETIIEQTATPIMYDDLGTGARWPNYATGWGEINVLDAVLEAQSACGGSGTIAGIVTAAGTGDLLAGVNIEATLNVTTTLVAITNAAGEYDIQMAPEGTYEMTASLFGYLPETVTGVDVVSGTVTIQDFVLTQADSAVVSGVVTDINTGWPLYARIDVDGVPTGPFWTDPATGFYSITLPEGATYDFEVSAFVAGYLPEMVSVGPLLGDETVNVELDVDVVACNAPGYQPDPASEDFYDFEADDGGFTGTVDWEWGTNYSWVGAACDGVSYPPPGAFSGVGMWATVLNDCHANTGTFSNLSFSADLTGQSSAILQWWDWYDVFEPFDYGEVYVNNTLVYDRATSYVIPTEWEMHEVDLTPFVGDVIDIEFRMFATTVINRAGWYIDDVLVGEHSCVPQAGSLVVGNVYDDNTNDALSGAMVVNDSGFEATAVDTPEDSAVADGFYTLFAPEGSNVLTATIATAGYGPDTAMLTVNDGETVALDFNLPAGWLAADPSALTVSVVQGSTDTHLLTLNNSGGLAVDFQIQEQDGGYSPFMVAGAGESHIADIGDEWETMAPLPAGRVFNAVVADQNGYVYVIGGTSDPAGNVPTNTNYRYDTNSNTWSTMAPLPAPLMSPNGVEVNNKIYIPGDSSTANTYVYDIATDNWSTIPANGGYTARNYYQIVAIGSDVYVLGGIVAAANASTSEVWVLDTTTETWSAGVPMQNTRVSFSAAAIDGAIYVAGGVAFPGFVPDMTAEKFDGTTWSFIASVPDGGGTYTRWSYNAAAHGADGLWLAAGRRDAGWNVLNHAGYYDPDTDTWTVSPDIPSLAQGRVYMEGTVASDGYFYVIGGRNSAGSVIYTDNERLYVGSPETPGVFWMTQDPETGTVPANDSFDVEITFTAFPTMSLGTYTATLRIDTDQPVNNRIDIPVTMYVVVPPEIAVDPDEINSTQFVDMQRTRMLEVSNLGGADLEWHFGLAPPTVLYDNGPLVTHVGTGPGGADESAMQSSLGMTTFGGNVSVPAFRIADNFTVTVGGWQIDQAVFYAYQTGSGTASTFTVVNFRIWDGPPDDPASNVVFGDDSTNRFESTDWTNIYRRSETSPGNTQRPIMYIVGEAGVNLAPGTYWIDWQLDGTLASGPWQPPITILGETTTGNALQFNGTNWQAFLDSGTNTQQGAVFQLWGAPEVDCDDPADLPWLDVSPDSGVTPGSETDEVAVTLDSTGLAPGTYTANLCVISNDPTNPVVEVPVTMTVEEEPIIGLQATNDSPTVLGNATTLTATIQTGTNVTFTWDFGDGTTLVNVQPAITSINDFSGDFDLANWTLVNDPPGVDGSYNSEPGPPIELYVVGGNDGVGGVTDFEITIPEDGVISFNWGYQSTDTSCWDTGGVVLNGVYDQLACKNPGMPFFDGLYSVAVEAGDTFAFRIWIDDGLFGAGTFGVTNFDFQPSSVGDIDVVAHTYPDAGSYTATVTATNSLGAVVTTTIVEIVADEYGVELSPTTDDASGDPGDVVEYTLTITNTGSVSDTFNLMASGNDWDVDLPDEVELDAGASTTFIVAVTVPTDAAAGASDTAMITATSTEDPSESASSELTTTANAVYGVELSPDTAAQSGLPGEIVTYTLTVTNTGNATDSFGFDVAGNAWGVGLPMTVTLDMGQSVDVAVTVEVPEDAAAGDYDMATVTATSVNDPSATAAYDLTTLTTTAGAVYGVALAPVTAAQSGMPGTVVSYTLTVTNTGNITDVFSFTASGDKWTVVLPSPVTLDMGESADVMVTVEIPSDAAAGANDVVTITATSTGDAGVSASSTLTTTAEVEPDPDPEFILYLPVILHN